MRHKFLLFGTLLSMLFMTCAFQSCNESGDETISLEYGYVKKMIIGVWVIEGGTRVLTFTDDGYYTDSSDGERYRWRLGDDYKENEPYYGGIYLNSILYNILSFGGGKWVLVNTKTNQTLVLTKNGGDGNGEGSDISGGGGNGRLVSKIDISSKSGTRAGSSQSIVFYYDDNNRVTSADYIGEEIVIGPVGGRVHFNISNGTMKLSFSKAGSSSIIETLPSMGKVNNMGLLESEYFESSQQEINSGKYATIYYEHNNKGQITKMSYVSQGYKKDYIYSWTSDCLTSFTGSPGGAGYAPPKYSNNENKSNIDVNLLIFDQLFDEDIFGLALCGYVTVKSKNLIEGWKVDNSGYPLSYEDGEYIYRISYTR